MLSAVNQAHIDAFWRRLKLEQSRPRTLIGYLSPIRAMQAAFPDRDWLALSKTEIEDFCIEHQRERVPRFIKKFYRIMGRLELVQDIRLHKYKRTLLPSQLLVQEDIDMIMSVSGRRDRAITALLWECGLRPVELLTMKVSSINFQRRPAYIFVSGKTEPREIPISKQTAEYLIDYIDHSRRLADGSLWAIEEKAYRVGSIGSAALAKMLRHNAFHAGIRKHVYPYLFRHSAISRDAKLMSDSLLKLKFGWTMGSTMAATYVHLDSRELEKYLAAGAAPAAYTEVSVYA